MSIARGISSRVSASISDSPVYFYCAHLDGRDYSFVLEDFPGPIPQFKVVLDTLRLSRIKKVPREFKLVEIDDGQHPVHPVIP